MIKLVVIDFDDTLCLTEAAVFEIENRIAKEMGFVPMTRDAHLKNWGIPLEEAIEERIPGIDGKEFLKKLAEQMPSIIENGELDTISDENFEILQNIKLLGKHLAILTSRTHGELKHVLEENHPLNKTIEEIYYRGKSKFLKPDPRVFDEILERFDVRAEEAVYVGDTLSDGICAKGAGLHFIAVLESGIKTKDDFKEIPVDFFANKFPEVLEYINRIN